MAATEEAHCVTRRSRTRSAKTNRGAHERRSRSRTRRVNHNLLVRSSSRDLIPSQPQANGSSLISPSTSAPLASPLYSQSESTDCDGSSVPVKVEIDVSTLVLFVITLVLRVWRIGHPNSVVFDEALTCSHLSSYHHHRGYVMTDPPLYSQILLVFGEWSGVNLTGLEYLTVSSDYPPYVPYITLRMVSVVSGSFTPPLIFHILVEMGVSRTTSFLSTLLAAVDTVLICESRMMTASSLSLSLSLFSLLFAVKTTKQTKSLYKFIKHSTICSIFIALSLSVQYRAASTFILCYIIIGSQLLSWLQNPQLSSVELVIRFVQGLITPALFTLLVMAASWTFHVYTVDIHTTPHQPRVDLVDQQPVFNGSTVTIQNYYTAKCWLHSHTMLYPKRYNDSRGSSHQQQVTCYPYMDANNYWIIVKHTRSEKGQNLVQNGDIIELIHKSTNNKLNSHNVAAPESYKKQEVSCYVDHNISMKANTLWKIDIENDDDLISGAAQFKLLHVQSSTALSVSGKRLPSWAHGQFEVVSDRFTFTENAIWLVDSVPDSSDSPREESPNRNHTGVIHDIVHLHVGMFISTLIEREDHPYSCHPSLWPAGLCNIPIWFDEESQAEINVLPNPALWLSSLLLLVSLLFLWLLLEASLLRPCAFLPVASTASVARLRHLTAFSSLGFSLHYIPSFLTDRQTFVHGYSPALVFTYMGVACFLSELATLPSRCRCLSRVVSLSLAIFLLACSVAHMYLIVHYIYGLPPEPNLYVDHFIKLQAWRFLAQTMDSTS